MNATDLSIEVASDLYPGVDEDGYPTTHIAFFAQATFPNGRRFVHHFSFTTQEHGAPSSAERVAENFARRIREAMPEWAGPVDNDMWVETFPVYGSEYFQEGGRGNQEMKAWEKRNEELPRREP